MKELKVHMSFYMEMKDGETEQEAKERFREEFIMEAMTTECYSEFYSMEVQEL